MKFQSGVCIIEKKVKKFGKSFRDHPIPMDSSNIFQLTSIKGNKNNNPKLRKNNNKFFY